MHELRNKCSREELAKRLAAETFERVTVSFYRYVRLADPHALRDELYREWSELNCLGRIYLAEEGINAQMNVPEALWDEFKEKLYARPAFKAVPFKIGLKQSESFLKLTIKVKKQIVADGLTPDDYDLSNVGRHLNAEEFNAAMENPETLVVDMRNHYESEIGRFKGAICPDADTFREELPQALEALKGKEDKKLLLYCTGGIRCEKASAFFKHHGFKDVNQLHGGIIYYAQEVQRQGLESKFKGKNFVFDERRAERITDDVLSRCHQCDAPCDTHTNCRNEICNLLFLQCATCAEKWQGCCTEKCQHFADLPDNERREVRKRGPRQSFQRFRRSLRPLLK